MGNIPDKESKSSSTSALNRSRSSPSRPRRSSSTYDKQKSPAGSPDSSRPPSRQNKDSLRRKVLRNANGRASNPNITFDQHPQFLSAGQRDLIRGNWDSQKRHDLCRRIYLRAFGKRPDIRSIFELVGDDSLWQTEIEAFSNFLQLIMECLDDFNSARDVAVDFGRRHGEWRRYGFKSEFWVVLAEAMTKECVYLDAAMHPPDEVLAAWSKLVGFIFGWIRDGYYESLRVQRQMSRKVSQSYSQTQLIKSGPQRPRTHSLEGEEALISQIESPRNGRRATISAAVAANGRRSSSRGVFT